MSLIHDRRAIFIANLKNLDAAGQQDAFVAEVIETFGHLTPPAGDLSHRWELDLHGISADGATEEEAIANWKRQADRLYPEQDTEDDGFITVHPRPTANGVAA